MKELKKEINNLLIPLLFTQNNQWEIKKQSIRATKRKSSIIKKRSSLKYTKRDKRNTSRKHKSDYKKSKAKY